MRVGSADARRALVVAITLVGAIGVITLITGAATHLPEPADDPVPSVAKVMGEVSDATRDQFAVDASRRFLDTYVRDGRVVRSDEGGDTVSEGQAYAMLIALAIDDRERFGEIWEWTRANLQRSDGLLAWRWDDGAVVDPSAASDADVLVAWALLTASERFATPAHRTDGLRVAEAVLEHETVDAGGEPVLVAGPWATRSTPSFVVPGYFAPGVFDSLADLTGDGRWDGLAASSRDITADLVEGSRLVPDWARVDEAGGVVPHGAPGSRSSTGTHGLDAARAYVWFATSCHRGDAALAATARSFHRREAEWGIGLSYTLDGDRRAESQHALMWVAAAASARASDGDVDGLLTAAEHLDDEYPSYYGSAWVSLGRLLLTTDRLAAC